MSKSLTLSIIIPVHNEEDHIIPCLEAISAQTVAPLEIIIVDNNCSDKTIQLAQSYDLVRVVREPKPGIAHARNAGFNAARGDIIGRIDADTIIPETWVEEGIAFVREHPGTLLTGGCYLYDLGMPRLCGWITETFSFRVNKLIIGSYIAWGSNLVFHRNLWDKVKHRVNNSREVHEDIDLGLCLRELGHEVVYRPGRKVGVDSRIFSEGRKTRAQQMEYLQRWPETLYAHNMKRAWLGVIGKYAVYYLYVPLICSQKMAKAHRYLRSFVRDEI